MRNIKKFSKNGMPTWDSMLGHVLAFSVNAGTELERRVLVKGVADNLGLDEKLRSMVYESEYGDNIIENRLQFTVSSLKIAGLLDNVRRGVFKVSDLGKEFYHKYGFELTKEIVESTPMYIEHERSKNNLSEELIEESVINARPIETLESIDELISKLKQERMSELHSIILNSSPYLFEEMVVKLLSEMGYKGQNGKSFVTQKSNDGGIDGLIYHDPLGTQTIYIQAKRYKDGNNVGRPEIEAFYGALSSINASRGVVITTSKFTAGALEAAKRLSIITIDKDKLLDLLFEHGVGIERDKTFFTYRIDDDFFV